MPHRRWRNAAVSAVAAGGSSVAAGGSAVVAGGSAVAAGGSAVDQYGVLSQLFVNTPVSSTSYSPVNLHQCEACGHTPPTTVDKDTQTDTENPENTVQVSETGQGVHIRFGGRPE